MPPDPPRSARRPRPLAPALALALGGCFVDEPSASTEGSGGSTSTGEATSTSATTTGASTSETSSTAETSAVEPVCGDGKIEGDEACDSGALNGTMSLCKLDCTLNVCGDGVVSPIEECDDGDDVDLNACSNLCVLARCGDGVVQVGESCDDGNDVAGDGCSAGCVLETCGNGTADPGEGCDDGNAIDDDACTNACTAPACGDGIIQIVAGEECDDAENNVDGLACSSECQAARCGDGILQAALGEACDDGNRGDGDGCSTECERDAYFVFVSGNTYDGNLGGRKGADALCQQEAADAGLGGVFRAWISDTTGSPQQSFVKSTLPYIRVDGEVVALSYANLVAAQSLKAPLNVTPTGDVLQSGGDGCGPENSVWTNTETNGSADVVDDCNDWLVAVTGKSAVGRWDRIDGSWTDAGCTASCIAILRLYCFEEP
ncbi:MAG: DUF4215 domain-containing protein [Nannocystaceae bacterium]